MPYLRENLEFFNGKYRCMTVGMGGKKAIQHGAPNKRKIRLGAKYYDIKRELANASS